MKYEKIATLWEIVIGTKRSVFNERINFDLSLQLVTAQYLMGFTWFIRLLFKRKRERRPQPSRHHPSFKVSNHDFAFEAHRHIHGYNFPLLLVLFLSVPAAEAKRKSFWNRWFPVKTVTVTNMVPVRIILTCFSFDDNLGEQRLWPGDQFTFKFRERIWPNTRFNCSQETGVFEAYRSDYECNDKRVNRCWWRVHDKNAYRWSWKENRWVRYYYRQDWESVPHDNSLSS